MLNALIDLFYPTICMGCGNDETNVDELLCLNCHSQLPYTGFENISNNATEKLFWGRIKIKFGSSTFYYLQGAPIQQIIHQIKYNNEEKLGIYMGKLMGLKIQSVLEENEIDLCIPMPLHIKKEYKRGYNQATLLCKGIQEICSINFDDKIIFRTENTNTQTKKSRIERWNNVDSIFMIKDNSKIKGKHILIIDDVITTGASTEACGQTLLEHGAESVSICGLAYTI